MKNSYLGNKLFNILKKYSTLIFVTNFLRASDLEWLVSEEDAPQALLPMPKSWPVSPDDPNESITPLRGTKEWAPPRPQIIFTPHPRPE